MRGGGADSRASLQQKLAGTILLENQGTSKVDASQEIPTTVADRI